MRFTYDPRYNIAYIRFHEKSTEVKTIRVSYELNVDMAPDGTIYGIELLNIERDLFYGYDGQVRKGTKTNSTSV